MGFRIKSKTAIGIENKTNRCIESRIGTRIKNQLAIEITKRHSRVDATTGTRAASENRFNHELAQRQSTATISSRAEVGVFNETAPLSDQCGGMI
ncbi:hypothetical protein EVAR_60975_1 [Eumeta japonica]|uniref:Uncharacterized protein n=1 Tax=Eumeta variegata TaxID=151549 RepID=A0A4C1XTR9_EUMVA|nr:hypothetical protein EVAR_60975_1 [Eumeta japonica]